MSVQSIIQGFQPAGKFLLLIGLFLFCLGLASVAQALILFHYTDLKFMKDMVNFTDFSNPTIIKGMKIAQAVSTILAFIVPALLFAYIAHPCPSEEREFERVIFSPSGRWGGAFSYLNLNKGFNIILGIAVVILVFSAMPVINWAGELNSHLSLPDFMSGLENWIKSSEESLKKLTEAFLQMNNAGDLFVNLIVIALLAAVGEELLFRGAMQNIILEWTNHRKPKPYEKYETNKKNVHAAVWITAIFFSALHAQFYGFLPRMFLGVVLGYLYIWSSSLWLPILFHFLNNGLAVLFAYLINKGTISETAETVGTGDTPIYFVLMSAVISIGLMYVIYMNRREPQALNS